MNFSVILGVMAGLFAVVSAGALVLHFVRARGQVDYRSLMSNENSRAALRETFQNDEGEADLARIKKFTKQNAESALNKKVTFEERLFRGGMFSEKQKNDFERMKVIAPPALGVLLGVMLWTTIGIDLGILGVLVGVAAGFQLPLTLLDKRFKARQEEIMFYLPLVVEQISIGVSSSLDIGPCLQRVVQMADERDSHNVVTELLSYVQYHVKSGMSMEEALKDIGRLSGSNELKHAFVSLSQVAKHGGEISKQLQELADAVSQQRETQIEAKIKKLELEATGPVALVFAGFMGILLIGFGLQIQGAFG